MLKAATRTYGTVWCCHLAEALLSERNGCPASMDTVCHSFCGAGVFGTWCNKTAEEAASVRQLLLRSGASSASCSSSPTSSACGGYGLPFCMDDDQLLDSSDILPEVRSGFFPLFLFLFCNLIRVFFSPIPCVGCSAETSRWVQRVRTQQM